MKRPFYLHEWTEEDVKRGYTNKMAYEAGVVLACVALSGIVILIVLFCR